MNNAIIVDCISESEVILTSVDADKLRPCHKIRVTMNDERKLIINYLSLHNKKSIVDEDDGYQD